MNNSNYSSSSINDRNSTNIEMCNPLYQRLNNIEDSDRLPYDIIDAQAIIIDDKMIIRNEKRDIYTDGTYMSNVDMNVLDNPNVFAKMESDVIRKKIINGSYVDGANVLKIDNEFLNLSKPVAERQSEILSNNTYMGNILDEVAQDPTRITIKPSFNSPLPTYEIGTTSNNTNDQKSKEYKIEEYESIYDKGYIIEDFVSSYE